MIFCITLFQRAASRVKKRQSGAEDPRLRAACVNRVLCPLVARCRPAHVIGQHGQCTMRGRVAVLSQVKKLVQHSNSIFAICNSTLLLLH